MLLCSRARFYPAPDAAAAPRPVQSGLVHIRLSGPGSRSCHPPAPRPPSLGHSRGHSGGHSGVDGGGGGEEEEDLAAAGGGWGAAGGMGTGGGGCLLIVPVEVDVVGPGERGPETPFGAQRDAIWAEA